MKRAIIHNLWTASIPVMLAGCSMMAPPQREQPLTAEQLAYIRTHSIVVQPLPADYDEPLRIYTRRGKIGTEIGDGIAQGILTHSYNYTPEKGDTPRDRLNSEGAGLGTTLKNKVRSEISEEIHTNLPTRVLNRLLAERYPATVAPTKDNLTISTSPVAWHLYYATGDTYTLEYASNITLTLPAANIRHTLRCDRKSTEALSREQWQADDAARIRDYAQETALQCANQALDFLQLPRLPIQQPLPQAAPPIDTAPTQADAATTKQ